MSSSVQSITSGGKRGCGYREPGGAYLAVPLVPGGRPIEEFLIDPPQLVDPATLGLSAVGIKLIPRTSATEDPSADSPAQEEVTHHVWDIVGREDYPTVAEYIDEARRMGISRRISASTDFSKITPESRLLLLHPHAHVEEPERFPTKEPCPCEVEEHIAEDYSGMCARLWWQEPLAGAKHRLAIFASFPIPQIEVVRDQAANTHRATARAARRSGVDVVEVDQ